MEETYRFCLPPTGGIQEHERIDKKGNAMLPRKAVFAVGGWGTRFLPATKVIPKAMFPILNKPIIHYAVEEAIDAGFDQIIFVVTPNNRAIEEYFSRHSDLETYLEKTGNSGKLREQREICCMARFSSTQARPRGEYQGLGVGVLNAKSIVGEEPFAVILPNDFLETEVRCMSSLMAIYSTLECPILAVHRVPVERIITYGNVKIVKPDGSMANKLSSGLYIPERVWEVEELKQKPDPEKNEHLSDYAIVGRFILEPGIFPILEQIEPGFQGEVQLIDALEEQRKNGQRIFAYEFEGDYFDTRSELGYTRVVLNEAAKLPEIRREIRKMILSSGR
jgi:UTP--glucose-1-phosphate uridylyltransferase